MATGKDEFLRAVVETGVLLSAERDLERLLQKVVENARGVFGAEGASIYVREGETLTMSAFSNPVLAEKIRAAGVAAHYRARPIAVGPGSIAGYTAHSGDVVVIDDAYSLPAGLPYCFDASFDDSSGYRSRSIVSAPLATPSGGVVGVLQLVNTADLGTLKGERMDVLKAFSAQAAVAVENAGLIRALEDTRFEMITRLAAAAEFRDKETGEHLKRMSRYSERTAEELGWDGERVKLMKHASPLHDIGKIAVPDAILLKPGKLDEDEWVVMRKHSECGAQILAGGADVLTMMSYNIAFCHHERWDGKGYPKGLSGTDIPIEGRVVSLADVYDALTSRRPYKEPFPHEKAVAIVREGGESGQFDPEVTECFLEVVGNGSTEER